MNDYVYLTLGMLCAGAGVELLLRGAMGIAAWLRIPPLVAQATVAQFVYAGAEFAVVIEASRLLRPDLALGAALGTSIVNLGLVLALANLSPTGKARSDAGVVTCLLAIVAPMTVFFVAHNSGVSRLEGSGLLVCFTAWLIAKIYRAFSWTAKEEPAPVNVAEKSGWLAFSFCFVGFLLLASAGRLIVYGVEGLAATFNLNYFALGATLVPLCTTVPELTSAFAIRYRSPDGVSTKMLLENSLLNAWLLGGLAAVIAPYRITPVSVAITAAVAAGLALLAWPTLRVPPRMRGAILLAVYSGFLYYMS